MKNIYGLTLEEMEAYFLENGSKKFHALQLFGWLYEIIKYWYYIFINYIIDYRSIFILGKILYFYLLLNGGR